jgi:putative polyhydroxyalkanoate system protein
MSRIHFIREHRLGIEEARARVAQIAQRLEHDLHVVSQWQGNQLSFKRPGASGRIDVGDDSVTLEIRLGLLLAPLRHTIETRIDDKLTSMLG